MKLINSLDMFLRKSLLPLGILLFMLPVACNKGESELGVDLQDPYTFYNGVRDTVTSVSATAASMRPASVKKRIRAAAGLDW